MFPHSNESRWTIYRKIELKFIVYVLVIEAISTKYISMRLAKNGPRHVK